MKWTYFFEIEFWKGVTGVILCCKKPGELILTTVDYLPNEIRIKKGPLDDLILWENYYPTMETPFFSASKRLSKPAMRVYLANSGSYKADIAENE